MSEQNPSDASGDPSGGPSGEPSGDSTRSGPVGAGHGHAAPPLVRMAARDRNEEHRAATPLELFFDLCFVVAIAQAGLGLVHALAEGHPGHGITLYLMTFFAIWWAWMNFSWFASAYDVDDVPYRLVTLIQIVGVLILAASVPRAFEDDDFDGAWFGYVVMRIALVSQWLRAAWSTGGAERATALRYAIGVTLCQVGWSGLLFLPDHAKPWLFLAMACVELTVPAWAERAWQTTWHPHHIAERYGLFTIIVLGETIAASTTAVRSALDEHEKLIDLLPIAAGGLLIIFSAWWIYFVVPAHERLTSNRAAFLWGYGHYLVFGSAAAIGAGIEVAVEQTIGKAHISVTAASAAVTVPAAVYFVTVWVLHARFAKHGIGQAVLPATAIAVLACTFAGRSAVLLAGLASAMSIAVGLTVSHRQARAVAR
ncbi:low temperature requirement protein A [Streptomyces sp. NPDC002055]|uniref:low temperature requirement protein A n=1 Tax=Streptomyces sp. NPDC002055 TaxID=3154534 RepID=UPI00332C068D